VLPQPTAGAGPRAAGNGKSDLRPQRRVGAARLHGHGTSEGRGIVTTTPVHARGSDPVVVVGAGPTGITAAILLAQRGLPVVVLERHLGVYPLPRAVHLDDEVRRILQQVGVGPAFDGISRPGSGMRVLDARHRVLAEFRRPSTGPHGHPQANMFDQPDLEQLLRAHLAAHHPEVRVHEGVEVEAVIPSGTRPVVRYRDLDAGAVRELPALAVLGCDGANSLTRRALGSRWRDLRFEEPWLVVDGRCPRRLATWDGVDQICDPARAATFMRVGDDRYRWEFRMRPGEDLELLSQPAHLDALLEPWLRGVPRDEFHLLRCSSYTFRARVADRWHRDRVFLLGDAAHLTPPFIGQGLGAGLRDAVNLVWKLELVVSGRAPAQLLDTYQAERRRHVVHQIRLARTAGWALTGGGGAGAALRRGVLRTVFRVPGLAPRMLDRSSPPLRGGALTSGHRRFGSAALIGTLVPQPRIGDDMRPLDELLGSGPSILCRVSPDDELRGLATQMHARLFRVGEGGTLAGWLAASGASAAVIRPDRVVLSIARSLDRPGAELARRPACAWLITRAMP
jgi:3-(3-hydroxy-phenyl)propionate hydroxylase